MVDQFVPHPDHCSPVDRGVLIPKLGGYLSGCLAQNHELVQYSTLQHQITLKIRIRPALHKISDIIGHCPEYAGYK